MFKLSVGFALVTLVACLQYPSDDVCEAGQTCCQAPNGDVSCCPYYHGECCEDHLHCCPEGMMCQVMESVCQNATHSLPWVERMHVEQTSLPKSFRMIPSLPASESEITCLDGSYCPAEFSCLLMSTSYGCCPVAQGIVCSDGKHCCPKGHECSADSSSCVKHKDETVLCGDGNSECPVDTTCCETEVDGQWACCPMPKAVCCDDKVHCCPEDSICDVQSSKCLSSTNQDLPMWAKFPARLRAEWEDHRPEVVTPEMSTEAEPTTNQITTALSQEEFLENFNVPCNDTAACPDNSTCCKTKDGGWACCPLPEAVCCDDFVHCCPHGQTCDVGAETCEGPSGSLSWFEKFPVQPISTQNSADMQNFNVPCNDTVACPDNSTCCKTKDEGWACCPLPEAVCCDDFVHCCPHGQTCDVGAETCEGPSGSLSWFEKFPVQPISTQNSADMQNFNVPCNDTVACPDNTTCCKTKDEGWACCPLPEAVCCDDFIHCCPHGQTCDVAAGKCEGLSGSVPWFEKFPVQPISTQNVADTKNFNVPCNDTVACPDNSTCCKTKDGGWACCPLPEAVCCDDFVHCCPHGQTCDVGAETCEGPSGSLSWFEKFPVQPISTQNSADMQNFNVPCNDTVACPDNSTCCKTKDEGWACCPLPEAVCCDDFVHCCPHGQTCDVGAETCEGPSGSLSWFEKFPVQPISTQNSADMQNFNVPCNDTVACPDNTTCCKTKDEGWACCPLPEAVCCDDFIHCCPHGQTCDVAAGKCEGLSGSVPWFEKFPVQPISTQNVADTKNFNVPCNDTVACPDNSTCCKTKDGGWACCPLPEAVCCDDFVHCCPHGQTCDVGAETCEGPSGSLSWFEKFPVQPISTQNSADMQNFNVPCNDTVACPDNSTCCKTKDEGWACCPLPEAVCCDDFVHCCPHGQTCDVGAETCEGPSGSLSWFEKFPVQPISTQNSADMQNFNVPCNDTVACPDNTTCCKTKDEGWACCPLPEAVCCDDFIHCCPHGQTCDVAAGKCEGLSGSVPWFEKFPVQPISTQNVADTKNFNVPCNDTVACPDNSTCCKTKDGGWACCPLPEAVCCDDFVHCCPHGQTCDVAAATCEGPSGYISWFEKFPVQPISTQNLTQDVSCDSSHICPESNTCCKNIDGDWNCCPMPEAVCCVDHFHCCPKGTTCNLITLNCDSGSTSVPMTLIIPALVQKYHRPTQQGEVKGDMGEVTKYNSRIPCDEHTSCPDHTTCCFITKTNKWGCCPLPNAVCCSDGEHCCPTGYTCDVSTVSCIQNDVVIPWYNKITAQSTPAPSAGSVSCDEKFSCSTGSTCCRLFTGEWGCCPIPEAVCCPDHEHCCPKGYTCDLGGSSCVKNLWVQVDRVPLTQIGDKKTQQINSVRDIQCGGGYSCLEGETCCPTSETSWGCCPSAKAACCDDMKHCCPAGYKCGDDGTCIKASGLKWSSWRNWSVFFQKKKFDMSV